MARTKHSSPTLNVRISDENYDRAVESKSGGCLIADAIKEQFPELTGVTVDMATVRATDRKVGRRYTWLTPNSAQHLLLSFDQGWPKPIDQILLKRAVKVTPVIRSSTGTATREQRLAELEAKEAEGVLTKREKASLTKMRKNPERPTSHGPADVKVDDNRGTVVYGGEPIPKAKHPNLLHGRDRHFGAKLADPGKVFQQAVDAAVEERLKEEAAE